MAAVSGSVETQHLFCFARLALEVQGSTKDVKPGEGDLGATADQVWRDG